MDTGAVTTGTRPRKAATARCAGKARQRGKAAFTEAEPDADGDDEGR